VSLFGTINALRGAQTYGEAWQGLSQAYEELTLQGATEAARRAITLRNELEGDFVNRPSDVGDVIPGGLPASDHALSANWRSRLARFSRYLSDSSLPGGAAVDPDAKPDALDIAGDYIAASRQSLSLGLIAAIILGIVYLFRK
jgi:hypothetical protein|tara:strand:- start:3002 stop:3430 length:429 start_codon:yes stop_codon:yes gene_type:complete